MKTEIKRIRKAKHITQAELAKLCSVSTRSIIAIEKGEQAPCLLLSYKLSVVLGEPLEELFLLDANLKDYESEQGEKTK